MRQPGFEPGSSAWKADVYWPKVNQAGLLTHIINTKILLNLKLSKSV